MTKKIQILFLLCTLIGLMSCNRKASLMKRHYTKGYYLSQAGKPHEVKARQHQKSVTVNDQTEKSLVLKPETKPKSVVKKEDQETGNGKDLRATEDRTKHLLASASKLKNNIPFLLPHQPLKLDSKLGSKRPSVVFPKAKKDDAAREALSLLWILILVLLIVYIIGLLANSFGLGWPFHILAVIILVLLILWLLRII